MPPISGMAGAAASTGASAIIASVVIIKLAINYRFKIVLEKQSNMYPELELWDTNVQKDNKKLAALYQLHSPKQAIQDNHITLIASCQLVAIVDSEDFIANALVMFKAYWQNDNAAVNSLIEPNVANNLAVYQTQLTGNQVELTRKGHYLSGLIHYGQEWYWGLKRLQYLEQRLNDSSVTGAKKLPITSFINCVCH